jgi:U3 small nucleolar RNA-associated protein 5
LHSSDAGLLEQCLSHSSSSLVTASVARLPSQLALPLIDACVLRLARGARGSSGKGGGGGASAQRATVLVAWIRAVLGAHGGYLMSMPEAVARLAGLHGVMAERAKLRDGLEGLRGRLEMVEVQMAMRGRRDEKKREEVKVTRYVEGESSDEDNAGEDVEVEVGSEGSVEDVELGASEDSDEESGSDFGGIGDSEDEDGSGSDNAGSRINGFIDDEAEEWSEESGESDDE